MMLSAISLGVFWRLAPSTMAIIRSRNASPGIGGDADDDPVGEHRGAAGDGGVVAAGAADDRGALAGDGALVDRGDAHHDLAVAGDLLVRLDEHRDPLCGAPRPRPSVCFAFRTGPFSFRAFTSRRAFRSVSACALPRPSAMASAKLAKSTVNQSQSETARM